MINELKRLLIDKFVKKQGLDLKEPVVINESNQCLAEQLSYIKNENIRLQKLLDTALDEIVQNRQRIDALLKQLKDKNGGR